jgi:hypothetical protein
MMIENIITALIAAVPPTIMAWVSWRESKKVHLAVNSRMTELLEITRSDSRAKGKVEERKESEARTKGSGITGAAT